MLHDVWWWCRLAKADAQSKLVTRESCKMEVYIYVCVCVCVHKLA